VLFRSKLLDDSIDVVDPVTDAQKIEFWSGLFGQPGRADARAGEVPELNRSGSF
jgi:hypothetical protein